MPSASSKRTRTPDLTPPLGPKLALRVPVLAASGTFGYGEEIADLADCGALGALITPTVTSEACSGNLMPRTMETPAGLLHALGTPNPGLKMFLADRLPRLNALPCPVIVNIQGHTEAEWARLAEALTAAGGPVALELNLASSQEHAGYPSEAEQLKAMKTAVAAARAATMLPLIAKLPAAGADIGLAARAVAEAGADVIAVSQAFPGAAVRLSGRRFRFPGVVGGLSGPCIKPLALYQVWRAAQAAGIPVLGGGGILNAEDALEFLLAGASAVAVGIANMIHPTAIAQITDDIRDYLAAEGIAELSSLVGAANRE